MSSYFFCFSFKNNRHTNVILISIFKNAQKTFLTAKNGQNDVFESHFFVRFQKYQPKEQV